jgi:hypothetical protein
MVQSGSLGAVQRVFLSTDAYDVQSDGQSALQLGWGRDLKCKELLDAIVAEVQAERFLPDLWHYQQP